MKKLIQESLDQTCSIQKCPYCKSKMIIKKGKRKIKQDKIQIYQCKTCKKYFSENKLKHKSYKPNIILNSITTFNLGNSIKETNKIINHRFKTKVPESTIHFWIKNYSDICTFSRLRKKYKINPKKLIKSKKFYHQQVYEHKFHTLKLNIAAKRFPNLRKYIINIQNKCPNYLFKNKQSIRCSNINSNIKLKISEFQKLTKENNALKLCKLALCLAKKNNERHQKVEEFMLINDSATVAVEVPVFLFKMELEKYKLKGLLDINQTITGHIDIIQVRYNKIYVLDYKAQIEKQRDVAIQVFLYTLALSKRTNINLENFVCGWFNDKSYYEFSPLDIGNN